MLEVRLFGTFDIQCDGKPVTLSSRVAQSLFAYLILTAGKIHRREKLAGMFWPDATEARARAYLRHELWRIRKLLSSKSKAEYLVADDINISFSTTAQYWSDAAVLKDLDDSASTAELMGGLSLFQGDLLPGFYDDWITQEREHLLAIYEKKTAQLLDLLENEKRWNDILEWAERWISSGHGPEAAYRYLMIAFDALGDRSKVAATYQRCVDALRELDLEPSEETRVLAFKRNSRLNIPIPLTSFIGREKELEEVAGLLADSRLVTLTGSGGVGKTRLAIHAVADVLDRFPDGIWFLDLAPLSDPALVPNTLVSVLGLRESGELSITTLLTNYFRSRTALVIFDNCEHLVESCAQLINSLLTSCESLAVLATSREVLRVSGEIPYRVPSLEIPGRDMKSTIDILRQVQSIRLFEERARVVWPEFAVNSQNAWVVAQICRRLDGIPLAIELAAARVNVLTVEQILKRLDDRFNLLTGGLRSALPRHQTLRATIEWSHGFLSDKERVLFRRLAVFIGGWTLEAAEEVCAGDDIASAEVLELLSKLVNKSLVITEESQKEPRYRMLETMRQYATEQLVMFGESDKLRDRHLGYFLNLAMTAEPHLIRPEQIEWLFVLDFDYENLRLALDWSVRKDMAKPALRLCVALGFYWEIRGHWMEGAKALATALAMPVDDQDDNEKVARVRALHQDANLADALDNLERFKNSSELALRLANESSDKRDIAIARLYTGLALYKLQDFDKAIPYLEESVIEFQLLSDPYWEAYANMWLGGTMTWSWPSRNNQGRLVDYSLRSVELARKAGERFRLARALISYAFNLSRDEQLEEAQKHFIEAQKVTEEIGSIPESFESIQIGWAEIEWLEGNRQQAKAMFRGAQARFQLLGDKTVSSYCLQHLGLLSIEEGDLEQAQTYLEEALSIAQDLGLEDAIAERLILFSALFYLQGDREKSKEYFRKSIPLAKNLSPAPKIELLAFLFTSPYFEKSANGVILLGALDISQKESHHRLTPLTKRYPDQARVHAHNSLGKEAFESAFAEGQKMALDAALDLALKTVEEM